MLDKALNKPKEKDYYKQSFSSFITLQEVANPKCPSFLQVDYVTLKFIYLFDYSIIFLQY